MDDVSKLLFQSSFLSSNLDETAAIGPIEVVTCFSNNDENSVIHGRGVVATRDVEPGECLFVIPPTVSTKIEDVYRQWKVQDSNDGLEKIAETLLLEEMKKHCRNRNCDPLSQKIVSSFLCQVGSEQNNTILFENHQENILPRLLGQFNRINTENLTFSDSEDKMIIDDEHLMSIIRRNAFGPDYHNYEVIEETWNNSDNIKDPVFPYKRILGIYPLAAMLNHSFSPNAVRVFSSETMIVHATAHIPKGTEITWPYIPAHSLSVTHRNELLYQKFHFHCQCIKCTSQSEDEQENSTNNNNTSHPLTAVQQSILKSILLNENGISNNAMSLKEVMKLQIGLEKHITSMKTSLLGQYMRVDNLNFYIFYFNRLLSQQPRKMTTMEHILTIATHVHFSLVQCNNACTEHISILHMCYEIISWLHSKSATDKYQAKLLFWTEQLKKVHMVRYGSLGHSIENVRNVMKHTRIILRNKNGLTQTSFCFL